MLQTNIDMFYPSASASAVDGLANELLMGPQTLESVRDGLAAMGRVAVRKDPSEIVNICMDILK